MKQILSLALLVGVAACSNSSNDNGDKICSEDVSCPGQVTSFEQVTAFDTCRNCHSSSATDRHGAPASLNFDTASEVLDEREEVLEEVSEEHMPPEPYASSFTQDQRDEIMTWICCSQGS